MSLFHAAARNCGGQYFNLKSVLGDVMLLDEDCDEIFCISSDETSNHNLSMRKQTLTEATLEEKPMDEIKKVEATKIVANAAMKQCQRSIVISNNKRKDTVKDNKMEDIIVDAKDKKDDDVIDEVTTRTLSDVNKNVEGTKIVVHASKQCQNNVKDLLLVPILKKDTVEDKVEDKIKDTM